MRRHRSLVRRLAVLLAVLPVLLGSGATAASAHGRPVRPLAQAHAHNDYEHERPLADALSHGFTSV